MTATLEPQSVETVATGQPKYKVLADQLRRQIIQGELVSGDQLPTFAEIGSTHRVTLTTVKRVYDLLEKEGLIERQRGRGTFVAEQKRVLTGNIGLLGINVVRYQQSQYYSHILRGIERYTQQSGQHLLFANHHARLGEDFSHKMDGYLYYGDALPEHAAGQRLARLPRVSMLNKEEGVSNVIADDYEGAESAVRHLRSLGHRRIACLLEREFSVPCQRYAGYRDALGEGGGEQNTAWARLTDTVNSGANPPTYLEWARANMTQWLREGWLELGCTAILVQNDTAAIGVMQTLHEEGIKVPQRVSVIGFDGTELCDHAIPRLVSMKIPLAEIGYTAAQLLHQQIESGQNELRTIVLPMTLLPGGTVARIAN